MTNLKLNLTKSKNISSCYDFNMQFLNSWLKRMMNPLNSMVLAKRGIVIRTPWMDEIGLFSIVSSKYYHFELFNSTDNSNFQTKIHSMFL